MSWLHLPHFNFLRGPTSGHIDVVRMLGLVGGIVLFGCTIWHLYADHAFSAMEAAGGFGAYLAGLGGGTAMKDTAVAKAVQGAQP